VIVIPAVDIKNGRCVRLFKGLEDRETVYEDDPLRAAERWAEYDIKRLHVVDLDGAFQGHPKNMRKIIEIAGILNNKSIECEIGGGIRSTEIVAEYIGAGAARIVVGTVAVKDPSLFKEMVSAAPGKISLGLDCRSDNVLIHGWKESSEVKLFDLLDSINDLDIGEVIYTEVERDGTGEGVAVDWLKKVVVASRHPVIASGGVGSIKDVRRSAESGAFGVIIGKALYDGRVKLSEALSIQENQ